MDLRKIQYFIAVADWGSFTMASEKNHISQSALSKHISDLEYELGVRLFVRTKTSVSLTPEGEALLPDARNLIINSGNFINHAHTLSKTGAGELRIGYSGYWEYSFLCKAVSQFSHQSPYTKYIFTREHHGKMNNLFRQGKYDLILTLKDASAALPPNTEWETLASAPLCAAVSETHWLASQSCVTLSDLENVPQIIVSRNNDAVFNNIVSAAFLESGLVCNYYPYSPDNTMDALLMVSAGNGVCLVTEWIRSMKLPGLNLVPLHSTIAPIEFGIAYKMDRQAAIIRSFINVCRELPCEEFFTDIA